MVEFFQRFFSSQDFFARVVRAAATAGAAYLASQGSAEAAALVGWIAGAIAVGEANSK